MRLATLLKFFFLALALLLTLWLLLITEEQFKPLDITAVNLAQKEEEKTSLTRTQALAVSTENILMEPRFTGRDVKGQSWDIRAQTAQEQGTVENKHIQLQDVTATLENKQEQPIEISALKGHYTQVSNTLLLTGQVMVEGFGVVLLTPELKGDLNRREATGGPVQISQIGKDYDLKIEAEKLSVTNGGERIQLTGNVHGKLTPPHYYLQENEKGEPEE